MNEIDLHGLTHDEALLKAENFLLLESAKNPFGMVQCRVITGNSKTLQDKIIKQILLKHNFQFNIPSWNAGEIIVS